jgi:hypothetical protein
VVELLIHRDRGTHTAVENTLVKHDPKVWRFRSLQDFLPSEPSLYLGIQVFRVVAPPP